MYRRPNRLIFVSALVALSAGCAADGGGVDADVSNDPFEDGLVEDLVRSHDEVFMRIRGLLSDEGEYDTDEQGRVLFAAEYGRDAERYADIEGSVAVDLEMELVDSRERWEMRPSWADAGFSDVYFSGDVDWLVWVPTREHWLSGRIALVDGGEADLDLVLLGSVTDDGAFVYDVAGSVNGEDVDVSIETSAASDDDCKSLGKCD